MATTFQSDTIEQAVEHMVAAGWRVIERSFTPRNGQTIDLVLRRGDIVVFMVEAEAARRSDINFAVPARMRHRVRRAAVAWMGIRPRLQSGVRAYRFDVILPAEGGADTQILTDAF